MLRVPIPSLRLNAAIVSTVTMATLLGACGGSSSSRAPAPSTPTTAASSSASTNGASASVAAMHATLRGENHTPRVGRPWHYSVTATDSGGHPLSGTVDTRFVFGGQVVGRESPPTHPLRNGDLHDDVTFPAQATGIPLSFEVVVHTKPGSVKLDWPVEVRR